MRDWKGESSVMIFDPHENLMHSDPPAGEGAENKKDGLLVKAQADDLNRIMAFYSDVIDRTPNMEKYARWMHGKHPAEQTIREYVETGSMYLYVKGETVLGAMAVTMLQGEDYHPVAWAVPAADHEVAVIHLLGVQPSYQGKGIGKQMIEEAVRLAREQGKKCCRLDALASNTPAHRMYESKGFQYRGTERWYAENTGWTEFYLYELAIPREAAETGTQGEGTNCQ